MLLPKLKKNLVYLKIKTEIWKIIILWGLTMTTGKNWMGGNPGSWEKAGSTTSPGNLEYIHGTQEGEHRSPALSRQLEKTQLKHHAGLLMLSIPGKLWASCTLKPGWWGKSFSIQLQSHGGLQTVSYFWVEAKSQSIKTRGKNLLLLKWPAKPTPSSLQTWGFERKH